jgi:cytochrome c553
MRKKNLITTVAGISFAAMSLSIAAEENATLDGATLYKTKTCFACHGVDAKTPLQQNYPKIAGQNKNYAIAQMKDIKSGVRKNSEAAAMMGIMNMVNDAEMDAIAGWLASLPRDAASGDATARGAVLYKSKICATCHGEDAQTPLMPNYPKLSGQNHYYALAQMKDIKSGARNNSESAAMKGIMSLVSDAEINIIAEWLSSLTGKEEVRAWNQMNEEQKFALKAKPDIENGLNVYKVCSACHLPESWGRDDGTFPQLAGQPRSVLIKQLADIRAGNRDNPTMYPFAKEKAIGGAQALADVTAYIATLPMNPKNGVGEGNDLKHGEKLYKENCVKCHGEKGEGNAEKFYPRIQAQHYKYMLRQFEWIRDGKRRNANPDMVQQIKGFTDKDMKAVIDYVSRLKPLEKDLAKDPNWKNPDFADILSTGTN